MKVLLYSFLGMILVKVFWSLVSIMSYNIVGNVILGIMFIVVPGYVVGAIIQEYIESR